MFLKTLTISAGSEIIREIRFRKGINLIVDESEGKVTGNSVGKTTVLKLIDFCLGADPKRIYEDPESKKKFYTLVRDFLVEKEVLITLCMTESLDNEHASEVFIERNFLPRNKIIRRINGVSYTEDEFEATIKLQLNKFNRHFASASESLYGEQYALKYDKKYNRKGQRLYKFSAFNTNFSSGKKQGEISCFDIAYTFFADEENIPCMHFLLNDKKELMHDNQLVKIARLANSSNIQFVASILKDKLPEELNVENYFILKLSDDDKLFRIEQRLKSKTLLI